jgi:hypothetical protein
MNTKQLPITRRNIKANMTENINSAAQMGNNDVMFDL